MTTIHDLQPETLRLIFRCKLVLPSSKSRLLLLDAYERASTVSSLRNNALSSQPAPRPGKLSWLTTHSGAAGARLIGCRLISKTALAIRWILGGELTAVQSKQQQLQIACVTFGSSGSSMPHGTPPLASTVSRWHDEPLRLGKLLRAGSQQITRRYMFH